MLYTTPGPGLVGRLSVYRWACICIRPRTTATTRARTCTFKSIIILVNELKHTCKKRRMRTRGQQELHARNFIVVNTKCAHLHTHTHTHIDVKLETWTNCNVSNDVRANQLKVIRFALPQWSWEGTFSQAYLSDLNIVCQKWGGNYEFKLGNCRISVLNWYSFEMNINCFIAWEDNLR